MAFLNGIPVRVEAVGPVAADDAVARPEQAAGATAPA